MAEQSPLASHSTLKGFLFQNWMSRFPCHQRQVAHFLSVRLTFCIAVPSFPSPTSPHLRRGEGKSALSMPSVCGTAKRRGKRASRKRARVRFLSLFFPFLNLAVSRRKRNFCKCRAEYRNSAATILPKVADRAQRRPTACLSYLFWPVKHQI